MLLTIAALAAATPAIAAKPQTLQARFDAANQAAAERRCDEAVAQYGALEKLPAITRNPVAVATVAVRKGGCLMRLGRGVEGEAAIRAGLPALDAKPTEFAEDIRDARLLLARAAQGRFDYDAAVAEGEKALAAATGFARVPPLLTLSAVTMFDGDARALRYAEEARQVIATDKTASKKDVAAVQTQCARVLLNQSRAKEAYALLRDSLVKQGGLGTRVNLDEVATRSDLAIAALLNNDKENARQFLAYTGAGRIANAPFATAAAMNAPSCDPAIGLEPSDVAVVEFSLGTDGQVLSARPIYVTGGRAAAIAFARAVADWSWRAEAAAKIPVFYRALTRVELRCTTGADTPDVTRSLEEAASAWLYAEQSAPPWEGKTDAAALPFERATLAAAPAGPRAELAALVSLIRNARVSSEDTQPLNERAAAIAPALGVPAAVHTWFSLAQLRTTLALSRRGSKGASAASLAVGLCARLADPVIAGDPVSAATVALLIANALGADSGEAIPFLNSVINAPGLPPHHPLKVNALLRKANLLAAEKDLAGADAAFRRTGLTTEQCAMLGVTPALRATGASSSDFPREAQRWGFEGWVRTEFDIAADGRTAQQRALIAYPPFVFDEAATGIARQSRWASSYRPGGSVACAASQMGVRFELPFH